MDAEERRLQDPSTAPEARRQEKLLAIAGALAYRRNRELEHALSLLLRATEHVPNDPELLLDLALLEDEMHLYRDADASAAAALKIDPAEPRAMYAVARIKMDLQQIPAAEQEMKAYLELRPEDASAHYGLGRMYRSELRNDEASAEFLRSLSLQPHQAESNYQLGEIALEKQDLPGAEQFYDHALAVDPAHAGALAGKAIILYRRKEDGAADTLLLASERSAPDFEVAHRYRGLVLARLGRKQESEAEFALASKLRAAKSQQGLLLANQP